MLADGVGRSVPLSRTNHFARVFTLGGQTADGGFVQRVTGLDARETYRLSGSLRSSWAVDWDHQCMIGLDGTGQEIDPKAVSIRWLTLPPRHGVWLPFTTDTIRPATNAVSVWLRAKSTFKSEAFTPFKADFDNLSLRQVQTSPPGSH